MHTFYGLKKLSSLRKVIGLSSMVVLFFVDNGHAARRYEDATAFDQSFTTGYQYQTFAERTHETGTFELLVPDEEKQRLEKEEEAEDRRMADIWRYKREAEHHSLYDSNASNSRLDTMDETTHTEKINLGMSRKGQYNYVGLFYDLDRKSVV